MPRVDLAQPVVAEAPPLQRAGAEVLHDDVGLGDQPAEDLLALLAPQVQGDRPLVAAHDRPPQRVAVRLLPAPLAHRVAAAGRLHLDHVGAQVAEQLADERPGQQRPASMTRTPEARAPDDRASHGWIVYQIYCAVESPAAVQIVEVSPRDGLQNESATAADRGQGRPGPPGARRRPAPRSRSTAFAHPDRVPQMADAEARAGRGRRRPAADARSGWCSTGAGWTARSPPAATRSTSWWSPPTGSPCATRAWTPPPRSRPGTTIAAAARAAGLRTTVILAAAFGCPFDGAVAPRRVLDVARGLPRRRTRRAGGRRHHRRRRPASGRPTSSRGLRGLAPDAAAARALPQHPQHRLRQRDRRRRRRA